MRKTLLYYEQNAENFIRETREVDFSEVQELFLSKLEKGALILDFGCGSGRDTKYFSDRGYLVEAVDGSAEMCHAASRYTGIEVKQMLFQELEEYEKYDGIWACASILHLTHNELKEVLKKILLALKKEGICNGIFNHTSPCEFHQGKLLLHLTIPFEEKPKTNLPSDNLKYYRQRKQMTTRQLAEKLDIVPATVVMYENGKHPIPYDVAIKLADVLEIEASLLYDDFSRFLAVPYTEVLKSVRTALELSQKAFAEQVGIVPSYYYKIEEGNRRPSRKIYQKICATLEATNLQTSLLWEHPLQ